MFALLMLLQSPSADIVVTGKHLSDEYAHCQQALCAPVRDAQVSIAFAERQFREGRYLDAKRTLSAAVARNRDKGSIAPKPLAALYEAYATVSLHEGDQHSYRRAVAGRVRTLRDNLPGNDPLVVIASPALGDMWIKLGNYRQADLAYQAAERIAAAAGEGKAAMLAALKRAALASAMGQPKAAVRMLDALAAQPVAQDPVMAAVLRVVRFRTMARDADDATMTTLIRQFRPTQAATPSLLWEPSYPVDATAAANTDARRFGYSDIIPTQSSEIAGIQWIDAGFWIRPNGHVDEVELLRGSPSRNWAGGVLRQIAGRRYAPSSEMADGLTASMGGVYRVERITRRTRYATPTGSLIERRTGAEGFETLDLTGTKPTSL
jgi:hypothetical protein